MTATQIRIQAILFNNDVSSLERSIESMATSIDASSNKGLSARPAQLAFGDASPRQSIPDSTLESWRSNYGRQLDISYRFFNENTGFGKGHNALAKDSQANYLFIANPDIVLEPQCFALLLETITQDGRIGIVEARQSPIEHPKEYDEKTGDTSWASGACMLVSTAAFKQLDGFDDETFFMYCEDVDLSWRMRSIGLRVVHQPQAIAYHPKHLTPQGTWVQSDTECYHGILSDLRMGYKWGNRKFSDDLAAYIRNEGKPLQKQALADFESQLETGYAPATFPEASAFSQFERCTYAKHRFVL